MSGQRETVSAKAIERMAYGYELMFEVICHMAGTSGAQGAWYMHKAQEVQQRLSPLWALDEASNQHKPGDCLRQHERFLTIAQQAAAAPKMFEALKWFISDIDGSHTTMVEFDENVRRARAALASASPTLRADEEGR